MPLLAFFIALALPASASANTYCVSDSACVSGGGINMGSDLQAALTAAQGNAGPDRVQIGPGDFLSGATGFAYNGTGTNSVEIDGAGKAQTTLRAPTAPAATSVRTLAVLGSIPDAIVSDLAVVIPGALPSEFEPNYGIRMTGGGTIERVDVSTAPGGVIGMVGIELTGTVRDSTIDVGNVSGRAPVRVLDATVGTVEDSVLKGFYGVYGDANGSTATDITVRRVDIEALFAGVYSQGSNVKIEDTLIKTPANAVAVGIAAYTDTMLDVSTIVRNSTLVGAGASAGQYGIELEANDPGRTGTVSVNSTIVTGFQTALRRSGNTGTANFSRSYSNMTGLVDSVNTGTLVNGPGLTSFANPGFANPGGGDYRLGVSSPLIDLGDPNPISGESTTDLAGDPRISNGRRDMGAFEFQPSSVKCAGKPATKVGTTANDTLSGTPGADVIVALAGNDVVRGLAANDVACGGAGRDRLIGGGGRDTLLGEAGRDLLKGGAKRDLLKGGAGRDRMVGGPGRDKLRGGPGRDRAIQ